MNLTLGYQHHGAKLVTCYLVGTLLIYHLEKYIHFIYEYEHSTMFRIHVGVVVVFMQAPQTSECYW